LPFCHFTVKAERPRPSAYPQELKTLGDHIRKKRLDLGLLQREVAEKLGVDKDSVYHWEKNQYAPSLRVIPRIIQFLDYEPFDYSAMSLGERIVSRRWVRGISQEEMAHELGVDAATLRRWERGEGKPLKEHVERVNSLFDRSASPSVSNLCSEPHR
jgi:transcriptional regulator with XRE-family HTH domain